MCQRKKTKSISVSVKNQKQRKEVRERLHTKKVKELYGSEKIEVEPVFGHIKYNRFFQRFSLRGAFQKSTGMGSYLCCSIIYGNGQQQLNQSEIPNHK